MSFPRRARSGHRNAGIITLSALISLGLLVGCSSGGGATKSDDNASGGGTASADGEIPTYDPIAIVAEEILVCDNGEKQITAYDLETGEPTMDPVGGEESWVQTFSDGYIVYDSSADDEEAEHTIYAYDGTEKGTFKGFSEELADSVVSHSLVPSSAMFAHREDGPASVDAKGNVVTIRHDRDSLFATTGFNFDDMGEVKAVAADGRFVVMRTDDGYFIVTPDGKTQHEIPGEDFRVFDGHIVIDETGPEARLLVPNK